VSKIINEDKLIPLGHGRFIRSSDIVGLLPITGFKRDLESRTRVLIDHPEEEIISGRTSETIARYMTEDEEEDSNAELTDEAKDTVSAIEEFRKGEKPQLIMALERHNTIKETIAALPYQHTKFYRLVKRYSIDLDEYKTQPVNEPELQI